VRDLLKKLDLAATQSAGWFSELPSETFRRHVWVTPFWEDDPAEAAELIGVERTLFGSDWPHAEGIAEPISYADAIAGLGDAAVHRIMRDNFRELTT
jgi:predicted TIM-barrel fold metal-dependent hydrolase